MRRRCQRRIVAGVTRRWLRSARGNRRISAANTARSAQSRRGRGLVRRRTATSWRSTRSSTSLAPDLRPSSTTSPSTCRKIKYSNRNDTLGSCPTSHHRWSTRQPRVLAPHRVRAVTEASGVSATTVRRGVVELESGEDSLPAGRARRAGGGRRRADDQDPELAAALLGLVEPDERGDPMSPLRWTTKSLRHLAEELARQDHPVSAPTVGRLLRENGFSLQGTAKTLEGAQHPDRDAQFTYINEQVKAHQVSTIR